MELIVDGCVLGWGPAKKNSTRIIAKPNGKRKTIPTSTYAAWEKSARQKMLLNSLRTVSDGDVEVMIFAYPSSRRPDVHNQIDGVLDALQCVTKRGLVYQDGVIGNDRQVKKVSIEFVNIATPGYLVVWVSKM
jgi:Holliday junction resolvase RusA-like endonuclease